MNVLEIRMVQKAQFRKMSEQFCTRELLPNSIISLMGSEKYFAEYKSKRTSHSLRRESQLIPVLSSFFIPQLPRDARTQQHCFVFSISYLFQFYNCSLDERLRKNALDEFYENFTTPGIIVDLFFMRSFR